MIFSAATMRKRVLKIGELVPGAKQSDPGFEPRDMRGNQTVRTW